MEETSTVRDPYEALGVSPDASPADIKKAYRKLAKRYHPDSTGGDKAKETRFKEVSTAYDIVGDPDKRARYDAMRRQGAFSGGGGGVDGGIDLGEILAQMFGGAAGPGAGPRGGGAGPGGVRYRAYSTPGAGGFRESFFGGGEPFGGESPFDFHEQSATRRRAGRGQAAPAAEHKVRASDGSLVTQRGSDVHSDVKLSFDQAVLGAVVEVPTLGGRASVKIPPGTSSGVKLRLKAKGADDGSGHRGDHFVTVQIDVPKQVDDEAKRLLVAFMARAGSRRGGDNT
jgi:DnaJ-class molecular chaperone